MLNLRTICVAVACLAATSSAWAATQSNAAKSAAAAAARMNALWANKAKPYAQVLMPKTALNFGEVANAGGKKISAKLTPTIVANHPYQLAFSFAGLTLNGTALQIPPSQLTVTVNGIRIPVGNNRVQIKSGAATSPKGVAVPITIEVTLPEAAACKAGRYGGSMTLYVK